MSPKSHTLKRIWLALKDRKKAVIFLLILIIGSQVASILVPFILKVIIDSMTNFIKNGGVLPLGTLIYSAIGILVTTLVSNMLLSAYNYRLFEFVTRFEDYLRNQTFEKYLQLHALFHHGASSGLIIGRIERGANAIYNILYDIIGQNFIPPIIIFLGAFSALLYENIWIALVILIPFPVYLFTTRHIANRIYLIEQESNDAFEIVSRELYDVAGNVLTVKKFSQEERETKTNKDMMAKAREIQYSAERLWQKIENMQTIISTTGRVAIVALSAYFVLVGTATIGQFVLYITLQNMAYQPLSSLGSLFTRIRRNLTRVERLFTILDEPLHAQDIPRALPLPPLEKSIEFKNVYFSYDDNKRHALENISVLIKAGTTVALVGRSGSGKTTFINLLLRSYDPQKGSVLVDGIDIRTITQGSLRQQIAVVPQEVDLFSRTVYQNISYGLENITKEKVENAARTALAHDFILKLENGYNTLVGERGIKLSGGERQRVGIARALLRDPKILILDEATSNLDTESEQMITRATDALVKNRTSIIIAHRLSTVMHADKILVFNNGKIEAEGSHTELLKSSKTYAKLHSLQFQE